MTAVIDRRTALAGVTAMFGTALFAPIARLAAQDGASALAGIDDGPPTTAVFSSDQRLLVEALSERVLPATDTPGALAAGVPDFIEKLLADWSYPQEREPILEGLGLIDARSKADFGVPASVALPEQQDSLLTLAMNNGLPGGGVFFIAFRQLVVTGYFTSEIGMTQEREYLPIPGRYDGTYPYSNVNKVFSS